MNKFIVNPIGKIKIYEKGMFITVDEIYIPALKELDGFSHINIICWFNHCDNKADRSILEIHAPYKNSPQTMGVFATRSPARPNPIAITTSQIIYIDYKKGVIQISYTDAADETPVIDLKPYTPSLDRVESPGVPIWCKHWPNSLEKSGVFNWENEFNDI